MPVLHYEKSPEQLLDIPRPQYIIKGITDKQRLAILHVSIVLNSISVNM